MTMPLYDENMKTETHDFNCQVSVTIENEIGCGIITIKNYHDKIKLYYDPAWRVNSLAVVVQCGVNGAEDKQLWADPDWIALQKHYADQEAADDGPYGRIE